MTKYDLNRIKLLFSSYVVSVVATKLRNRYGVWEGMTLKQWQEKLFNEHSELFQEVQRKMSVATGRDVTFDPSQPSPSNFNVACMSIEEEVAYEILLIADELEVDARVMRNFILYNKVEPSDYDQETVHSVEMATLASPINNLGTYIKVTSRTTLEDLREPLKKAKKILQDLANAKRLSMLYATDNKEVALKKVLMDVKSTKYRKDVTPGDSQSLDLYKRVEDEIKGYAESKAQNDYLNEELGQSLVGLALTTVAEDLLLAEGTGEPTDDEVVKKRQSVKETYYAVCDRYRLPTLRDLPSLLALIRS